MIEITIAAIAYLAFVCLVGIVAYIAYVGKNAEESALVEPEPESTQGDCISIKCPACNEYNYGVTRGINVDWNGVGFLRKCENCREDLYYYARLHICVDAVRATDLRGKKCGQSESSCVESSC